MISGAYAAAVTPLKNGGADVDYAAVGGYVAFLARGGLDGAMITGTAGEGLLLSTAERKQLAERFIGASPKGFRVLVQCGAQTTRQSTELARHAAEVGAAGVLAICPPYFPLDSSAQHSFLRAVAAACAPTPCGVYEFARASGYSVSHEVLDTLRREERNFELIKISDAPWENFSPYLGHGLSAFCGPESLIKPAIDAGAVGVISALAAAFPDEVAHAVQRPDAERLALVTRLREQIDRFPRQAALKTVLRKRGVALEPDVRAPLRLLRDEERNQMMADLALELPRE